MPRKNRKPTLTVANLFKNHSDRVLRLMLSNPKKGWVGPELAESLGISKSWAARALATLEFEKYAYRDGKKPHGRTFLSDPKRLIQRWKLSYDIEFNEMYSYRIIGKNPVEAIASASKKSNFKYAMTNIRGTLDKKSKKDPFYVYVWPYSKMLSDFDDILNYLENSFDFIPTPKKANLQILKPYAGEGIFENMKQENKINIVSDLQLTLDNNH